MKKPTVHLICSAHLDPVWQWRWEEGAAEAMATFRNAVEILNEHPGLIFNHNEAVLYQWVEEYDPPLFKEIRRLAREGRWSPSGGWYLQPDVNMPGLESLIRQIAEGRRYFREKFGAEPKVAYNFDSFGHGGGLPQVLVQAGYKMYIHMRPQAAELELPSDLYRWRGVDGSEILAYRIAVGLYHTEYDNIEQRLEEGTALALKLDRDVPVFWGIGNHGGGATAEDLEKIDAFRKEEKRVRVIHSTPDQLYEALRSAGRIAPVVEGDLQRVFTGCYTSLSRLKRQAQKSLGTLAQSEALRAASWWMKGQAFPAEELREAWKDHLFNDFHDVLSGSCTEPAEQDALQLFGKVEDIARRLRLGAAAVFNKGSKQKLYIPVTVLNANPSCAKVPVEVECMAGLRPFWKGTWHLRLFRLDGTEVPCQEEQPESLLPFNDWRRKVSFMADLPGVGGSRYEIRALKGRRQEEEKPVSNADLKYEISKTTGLVGSLQAAGREVLAGPLPRPLVIDDDGDSWGTDRWSYRNVVGAFKPKASPKIIQTGPIRTITESVFVYKKSRIVLETISYPDWPVLEFRLRIVWNEERKRLKLSLPTIFKSPFVLAEVPGGAISRPADGQEHVHGRWMLIEGRAADGKEAALGVVNSGQPGFDFKDGEIHLSVLRSALYCHEQGFKISHSPARKFADLGVHEVRLLVTVGDPKKVRRMLPGLADWLSAPPFALAHLRLGLGKNNLPSPPFRKGGDSRDFELLSLEPRNIRLAACKQSWDGKALIIRLHEAAGIPTKCRLAINSGRHAQSKAGKMAGRESESILYLDPLKFKPYEIKTIRLERSGKRREVALIEEQ